MTDLMACGQRTLCSHVNSDIPRILSSWHNDVFVPGRSTDFRKWQLGC